MTINPGDRVYLRGTVTEIAAGMAFVRIDSGADEDPRWPRLAEPAVSVFLDVIDAEPPVYLSAADIAEHFGVSASLVQTWRARYGPDRTEEEIAKAPSCPEPDMHFGVKRPQAGWRADRLPEWEAWRRSLPGAGAGGGRPRKG